MVIGNPISTISPIPTLGLAPPICNINQIYLMTVILTLPYVIIAIVGEKHLPP